MIQHYFDFVNKIFVTTHHRDIETQDEYSGIELAAIYQMG